MNSEKIRKLIETSISLLKNENPELIVPQDIIQPSARLTEMGFDIVSFGQLYRDLENRLGEVKLHMENLMIPDTFHGLTIGDLLDHIEKQLQFPSNQNPIVVYVDDEEENLFIFKRKFGKELNLKVFSDPMEALNFIISEPAVRLVITDEVMPGIKGNQLCDEVHKAKPFMKFILITGNPQNDSDLMYNSLRKNRFFEFIQKPVDYDKHREEYLIMINELLGKD